MINKNAIRFVLIKNISLDLVYADGGICLDILQNRWSPTYDVSAILTSIQVNIFFLNFELLLIYSVNEIEQHACMLKIKL